MTKIDYKVAVVGWTGNSIIVPNGKPLVLNHKEDEKRDDRELVDDNGLFRSCPLMFLGTFKLVNTTYKLYAAAWKEDSIPDTLQEVTQERYAVQQVHDLLTELVINKMLIIQLGEMVDTINGGKE